MPHQKRTTCQRIAVQNLKELALGVVQDLEGELDAQFQALAENVAGRSLAGLFRTWLYSEGKPPHP